MILRTFFVILLSVHTGFTQIDENRLSAESEEPAYKVMFESGFYSKAVESCTSLISGPPSASNTEAYLFLAYSYIMLGQHQNADSIFTQILDTDSSFNLSPIVTSPKIYEVYKAARSNWEETKVSNIPDSVNSNSESQPGIDTASIQDSVSKEPYNTAKTEVPPTHKKSSASPIKPVLMCMPGGTAQFINRQHVKGTALFIIQAAAVAVSITGYCKKNSLYSREYGWYEENINEAQTLTNTYKGGFIIFSTAWIYGIADGFIIQRKNQHR